MKKYNISYLVLLIVVAFGCTPDEFDYPDNNIINPDDITGVTITPNHVMMLADDISELDLGGALYKFVDSVRVLDSRIPDDWISYENVGYGEVERYFKADSYVGETLKFVAKYDDFVSDTVKVDVRQALFEDNEQVTIPVVFHVLDIQENINRDRTISDGRIAKLLGKVNGVFTRQLNQSPNGSDTRIEFKMAEYTPRGQKMATPGINRFLINEGTSDLDAYLKENELFWPYEHYLNVWLIYDNATNVSLPQTMIEGAVEQPLGVSLTSLTEDELLGREPHYSNAGLVFKLQDVSRKDNTVDEMVTFFGTYFGLLKTYKSWGTQKDYCDDTFKYKWSKYSSSNKTVNKMSVDDFLFESMNIMDDPVGMHREITQDQMLRVRWYIDNCPDRWMWKSNFAFTGIE